MGQAGKTFRQIGWVVQRWVRPHTSAFVSLQQPRLWLLAIVLGIIGIVFRLAIGFAQWVWLGTTSEHVLTALTAFPWWWPVLGPVGGGIVVGIILFLWRPPGRPGGVADVIEARTRETAALNFKD